MNLRTPGLPLFKWRTGGNAIFRTILSHFCGRKNRLYLTFKLRGGAFYAGDDDFLRAGKQGSVFSRFRRELRCGYAK